MEIIIVCDVGIEDRAVMLCHFQSAMSQKALKCKGIAAAIYEIFAGEGVSEQMDACLLDTAARVVTIDSIPQRFL